MILFYSSFFFKTLLRIKNPNDKSMSFLSLPFHCLVFVSMLACVLETLLQESKCSLCRL